MPDDDGGIRYAAPPGAIWGAEAVFFDEIGRCRPETANKLFPIIHERRIQGLSLERLRFRWAATNPPPEAQAGHAADAEGASLLYEGVESLDPATGGRVASCWRRTAAYSTPHLRPDGSAASTPRSPRRTKSSTSHG
jgi:MoxR-like ATPase